MEQLVGQLARIPGVIAVTLGGSRATGSHAEGSDWDLGLYYRGPLDVAAIRSLGYPGIVVEPGEWGRLVNGGGWVPGDGGRVDVLDRGIDFVAHWAAEAEAGRVEGDPC